MNYLLKFKLLFVVLLMLFISCQNKDKEKRDKINSNIVLINIKEVDRAGIAKAIDRVSSCKAKVIGVNTLFFGKTNSVNDSLLAQSIRSSGVVVLVSIVTGDSLRSSDESLTAGAEAEGISQFGLVDSCVTTYTPYENVRGHVLWSFPTTVVTYYNMELGVTLMNKIHGGEEYKIDYVNDINSYKVFDIDKLDGIGCNEFENKIVLLGYLGPGNEDTVKICPESGKESKSYRTTILANIISSLLVEYSDKK